MEWEKERLVNSFLKNQGRQKRDWEKVWHQKMNCLSKKLRSKKRRERDKKKKEERLQKEYEREE